VKGDADPAGADGEEAGRHREPTARREAVRETGVRVHLALAGHLREDASESGLSG
jgi:hypothetical protein